MRLLHLLLFVPLHWSSVLACSCFGPQTFCGTLDPPYAQPEWWIPDAVVLGVKLSSFAHGMDVLILDSFSGELHPGDTVTVWGDTGNLCRWYAETWSIGDTVIWGIMHTDQAGGAMEQPEDYHISICGTYVLTYQNKVVSGPITTEGGTDELSLAEFELLVSGCLTTSITSMPSVDPLTVVPLSGGVELSLIGRGNVDLHLSGAAGRVIVSRKWDGSRKQLHGLSPGAYVIRINNGAEHWVRKVIVP